MTWQGTTLQLDMGFQLCSCLILKQIITDLHLFKRMIKSHLGLVLFGWVFECFENIPKQIEVKSATQEVKKYHLEFPIEPVGPDKNMSNEWMVKFEVGSLALVTSSKWQLRKAANVSFDCLCSFYCEVSQIL